jgi:hypothetical protein
MATTTAKDTVRCVDFAAPSVSGTIGRRFADWRDAVNHARGTIFRHEYKGQLINKAAPEFHPRRYFQEDDVLVVYTRAFVHMRVTTDRAGGGGEDGVQFTWEVFRDGTVEEFPAS